MMKKTILLGTALLLSAAPLSAVMASAAAPAGKAPASGIQAKAKQGNFTGADVERAKDGTLALHWQTTANLGPVKVYWSQSPDSGWKELARTYASFGGLRTKDPNPGSRVYFPATGYRRSSLLFCAITLIYGYP
ncbi:hypothetical protein [Paenibacillus sp. AR247]|uniref:hypothetical protein n=1 Tax=Paenibacillus sp. AR247 TaxID=1631599 RepID=UPI0021585E0E|nr:hypothetical protein [Paenibacillus sp. AR247]